MAQSDPWEAYFSTPLSYDQQVQADLANAASQAGISLDPLFHPNAQAAQIRAQKASQQTGQAGMPNIPFFGHPGGMAPVGLQHAPSLASLLDMATHGYQQMQNMGFQPLGSLIGFNPGQFAQYAMPWMYQVQQPMQALGTNMTDTGGSNG